MFKKLKLWIISFFKKKEGTKKEGTKKETKHIATRHAKKRLEERHGEILTDEMITSFITDIKNGKAQFLKDTKDNTQAWIVTYKNKKYRIIYNCKTKIIITVYRNLKNKRTKPSRRKRKKMQKRLNCYCPSYKLEKIKIKKPYKRDKRVVYEDALL